ncbi:uroporphyrinogen-III synthase, partial [Blakeslea trispora]
LFLAGDKRRDLIPEALHEAHIPFHELQTYATCPHPALADRLNSLSNEGGWLVFFSPSGIKFILEACPHMKNRLFGGAFKIAAIGPTTADFIIHELGFKVDVVADKPDAEHLMDAMIQID